MCVSDSNRVTVLLVDDHAIWRGGVQSMLEESEFVVVGEASSGKEALEVARQVQPRLPLLDIRMSGGDGLEALTALKSEHPTMAVVMLTAYDNPTYLARAVVGGAAGYLLKGIDQIIGKLGISDRVQAAVWATRNGLAPPAQQQAFGQRIYR